MKIRKEIYLVTVLQFIVYKGEKHTLENKVAFERYPLYSSLLRAFPNEIRRFLVRDKETVKFNLSLLPGGACEFSAPLFKNNPTGKEVWKDDFPHMENLIGRLIVSLVKVC